MGFNWRIILMFFLVWTANAQDERYFRQIFSGDLPKVIRDFPPKSDTQFNVEGPSYRIDLDDDQNEELIVPQKRDGVDWIEIRNSSQKKIYEVKIPVMGTESHIYKIKFVHLSKKVKVLVLFVDEGILSGKKNESTARIFILAFENNKLDEMSFTEGPHIFHEKQAQREIYWRRDYNVSVYDIDHDGTREIMVHYNHIQRIMKYKGRGEWEKY